MSAQQLLAPPAASTFHNTSSSAATSQTMSQVVNLSHGQQQELTIQALDLPATISSAHPQHHHQPQAQQAPACAPADMLHAPADAQYHATPQATQQRQQLPNSTNDNGTSTSSINPYIQIPQEVVNAVLFDPVFMQFAQQAFGSELLNSLAGNPTKMLQVLMHSPAASAMLTHMVSARLKAMEQQLPLQVAQHEQMQAGLQMWHTAVNMLLQKAVVPAAGSGAEAAAAVGEPGAGHASGSNSGANNNKKRSCHSSMVVTTATAGAPAEVKLAAVQGPSQRQKCVHMAVRRGGSGHGQQVQGSAWETSVAPKSIAVLAMLSFMKDLRSKVSAA